MPRVCSPRCLGRLRTWDHPWSLAAILTLLVACSSPAPPPIVRVGPIGSVDELPLSVIQD